MDYFDEKFWNLAQASAWVIYREKGLANQLEQPTREEFMSLGMYTSMEPTFRQNVGREQTVSELSKLDGKLDGLYEAIADGLRPPGLKVKLDQLELHKEELKLKIASAPPPAPILHPNLAELYRR